MSKIFSHSTPTAATTGAASTAPAAGTTAATAGTQTTAPAGASATPAAATAPAAPPPKPVDVAAILDDMAAKNEEKLDWKKSIVDLMKLVGMDSSFGARKQLAKELNYTGDPNDSAAMNVWLHKQVLKKLSENGGKVPAELLH
jgi:3-oxoacyl-ACP reductase-like protein